MKIKLIWLAIFWLIPLSVYADTNGPNTTGEAYNREAQRQILAQAKKWRSLRKGMTENQVQKILGLPILIQGCSDSAIWYYQYLPEPNNPTQKGSTYFKTKSVDELLAEEKASHIQKMFDLIAQYKASPRDYQIGYNPKRYNLPKITCMTRECDNIQADLRKKAEFTGRFKNLVADYEKKTNRLAGDEILRSPILLLDYYNEPDWNALLTISEKKDIKAQNNWQLYQQNWQKLRFNMAPRQVHTALGDPLKVETTISIIKEYYGDSTKYGMVCYTIRSSIVGERLSSWVEPFWPTMKKINFSP